jgi:HSP20 family molecular chaperone IbpA
MNDRVTTASANAERLGEVPSFVPPTDIFETKDAIIMLLDMPGADPDSLDVIVDKRDLTISAHSTPSVLEGYAPIYTEYREGNYERAFTLSDQVDSERIDAVFKDGVLRLTLPKATPSPAKKIAVKSA